MMNKKFYWFLISYGWSIRNGNYGTGALTRFSETKNLTKTDLDDLENFAKKRSNCDNVAILAISYLGRMTKEEFNDE